MHAFTIEDHGKIVRHMPLTPRAKTKLDIKFSAAVKALKKKREDVIAYEAGYDPDRNQLFEVELELPATLRGLADKVPANAPALNEDDIVEGRPEAAVITLTAPHKIWCFQSVDGRSFLKPKGKWTTVLVGQGTFELLEGTALNLSDRVDAFYESGKLYFHSEFNVRKFLSLDNIFAPMAAKQVREFFRRKEFEVEDMDQLLANATDLYRRKLARVAQILGKGTINVRAVKYAANEIAKEVPGLSVAVRDGRIVVPAEKRGFTELVKLLNDDYVKSTVDPTRLFYANSKRRLGNGAARK